MLKQLGYKLISISIGITFLFTACAENESTITDDLQSNSPAVVEEVDNVSQTTDSTQNESEVTEEAEATGESDEATDNISSEEVMTELNSYYEEIYTELKAANFSLDNVMWGIHADDYSGYSFVEENHCYYGLMNIDGDNLEWFLFYPQQIKDYLSLDNLPSEKQAFWFSVEVMSNRYYEDLLKEPESAAQLKYKSFREWCNLWYSEGVAKSTFIASLPDDEFTLPDEQYVINQYAENENKQKGITVLPGKSFDLSFNGYDDGSGTLYTVHIESFTITDVKDYPNSNSRYIYTEIIGITDKTSTPRIVASCYDEQGYLLGEETIYLDVSPNVNFKLDKTIHAPMNTVKIEIHL